MCALSVVVSLEFTPEKPRAICDGLRRVLSPDCLLSSHWGTVSPVESVPFVGDILADELSLLFEGWHQRFVESDA